MRPRSPPLFNMAWYDDAESYSGELLGEIELLQAIYIHELVLEGPVHRPSSLTLVLHPSTGDDDPSLKYVCLNLRLEIPEEYPCVVPEISIQNPRGLSDVHVNSIQENLSELAKGKTGSPMLYDLIEYTKECLSDNNIPSCPCVICLENFHEGRSFIKTKCYHYFHSVCLGKYINHYLSENKKILCPMCRLEIDVDGLDFESGFECSASEETFIYTPDEKQKAAQRERQRVLEYQKRKGGIINIEEERNKFLIGIKEVPEEQSVEKNLQITSTRETAVTGKKIETLKMGSSERRLVEKNFERREGIRRDKSDGVDRAGKSRVNTRNYAKDANETDRNEKRIEKDWRMKEDYCKESRKREVSNESNTKSHNLERSDGSGPGKQGRRSQGRQRDNQGGEVTTLGKDMNRNAFSSRKNRENNISQGEIQKKKERSKYKSGRRSRVNNEDKNERGCDRANENEINSHTSAFCSESTGDQKKASSKSSPEPQKRVNDEDEERSKCAGTYEYKINSGLFSQSSEMEPKEISPRSADSGVSSDCSSNRNQTKSRNDDLEWDDGVKPDGRIGPKSSRRGIPRKARQDTQNISQAAKKYPPKTSNTSAAKIKPRRTVDMADRNFSNNSSNQKARGRDVTTNQVPLRRPPPGFEDVTPKNNVL